MINQIKHDLFYLGATKKYQGLSILIVCISVAFSTLIASKASLTSNAEVFSQFRQLYWMLAFYVITDE